MKNHRTLLTLFRSNTGKTRITPKSGPVNPVGYWPSKVRKIERFGGF